jgi:hypothetical protein
MDASVINADVKELGLHAQLKGNWLICTRWFKYDRDYLCVNKSQFVPVIFEPPCIYSRVPEQKFADFEAY